MLTDFDNVKKENTFSLIAAVRTFSEIGEPEMSLV
jgi:hypothetical protein